MIGKNASCVARFAVSEQSYVTVSKVVAIELVPLATTHIFAKDKVSAVWPEPCPGRPVREKSELSPRATWHFHQMDLWDICEARTDQHFSPNRIPIQQGSGTKLAIL